MATGVIPLRSLLDLVFTKNIDAKNNDSKTGNRRPLDYTNATAPKRFIHQRKTRRI
tara:strand:+ start:697 stop:864 length:168 start_codon:yes stop_codon:yes gene_type:complete